MSRRPRGRGPTRRRSILRMPGEVGAILPFEVADTMTRLADQSEKAVKRMPDLGGHYSVEIRDVPAALTMLERLSEAQRRVATCFQLESDTAARFLAADGAVTDPDGLRLVTEIQKQAQHAADHYTEDADATEAEWMRIVDELGVDLADLEATQNAARELSRFIQERAQAANRAQQARTRVPLGKPLPDPKCERCRRKNVTVITEDGARLCKVCSRQAGALPHGKIV